MKILVVDDDPAYNNKLCEFLKYNKYDSFGINSEKEAMDYLEKYHKEFNIALIDMHLDGIKDAGLNLIKYINKYFPEIVTIVITGLKDFDNIARCMEEGCYSYVLKEKPTVYLLQVIKNAEDRYKLINNLPRIRYGLEEFHRELDFFYNQIDETKRQLTHYLNRLDDEIKPFIEND